MLSTLEELQPEVRRVLEEAIAAVRAQEAEARDKVRGEKIDLSLLSIGCLRCAGF